MDEIFNVSPTMLQALAAWRARRLGERIRVRREELGWSVADCAAVTGMDEPTILAIESGEHLMSDEGGQILVKSSILLGVGFQMTPRSHAA